MGIDPITHKPFSQLFNEYGKISGFPNRNPFLQNPTAKQSLTQKIEKHHPQFFNDAPFSSSHEIMHFGCGPLHDSCEPSQVQSAPYSLFGCDDSVTVQDEGLMDEFTEEKDGNILGGDEYEEAGMASLSGVVEKCAFAAGSSAGDAFVEAILAHDSEMRLQFPEILDGDYGF